jgi:hypothetical protein
MLLIGPSLLLSEDKILIEFKGSYLAYSYDHNQIYGEGVFFHTLSYNVTCDHLKADIGSRIFYAYGSVVLIKEGERFEGDEFFFSPEERRGTLINYSEKVGVIRFGPEDETALPSDVLETLTLSKIQSSLFYFTCEVAQITEASSILRGWNRSASKSSNFLRG